MAQLKPYLVPIVALVMLGAWFFIVRPMLAVDAPPPATSGAGTEVQAKGTAKVIPIDPMVQGGLSASLVKEVVEGKLPELEACYREGVQRHTEEKGPLHGRLVLDINIRGEGTVRSASVAGSQLNDDAVGRCFTKKIAAWVFPESDTGTSSRVSYAFQLQVDPADLDAQS